MILMTAIADFADIDMKNYRVIKKEGKYYPQFRKTFLLIKGHKWMNFTYTDFHFICSGFAEEFQSSYCFNEMHQARDFLRRKGFKL